MPAGRSMSAVAHSLWNTWRVWRPSGPPIRTVAGRDATPVDRYWSDHTVNSRPFASATESAAYLEWRFQQYPLFREFVDLWGEHDDQVILDYGCGPGDDVIGFLLYTGTRRVVGVDLSPKALTLLRRRLALHEIDRSRVDLVNVGDAAVGIPCDDASVDYVHCGGVLHHASDPAAILREFVRVLRPGGRGCVMVYNRDSLWFHLYTAYMRLIVERAFTGLAVEEAFQKNTDGEGCPIARSYAPAEFLELARAAGFAADFVGGYLSAHELECWRTAGADALRDARLPSVHRAFLTELVFDAYGYPMWRGKHAGIGGVYRLRKA